MEKVRIYFIEITDTNNVKHRLKTDKLHVYNNFIARHQGKIKKQTRRKKWQERYSKNKK